MGTSNLKRGSILFIMMMTLVLCTPALAQTNDQSTPEPFLLTDQQERYPLGLHLEILEDPSGELTIDDVSSPEFDSNFVPSQAVVPNYGFTDSAYWVRFRLDNETLHTDNWLLEQGFANTHYVDLYTPLPDGGGFSVKETGVLRPVRTRDLPHPRIIFNLTIPPQSQATYYLRFQSGGSMTLALTLWTRAAFLNYALFEQTLMGIFFGVLIGLLFYNLFLLFTLRDASHLFFVILLASLIFEEASYDGYLRGYIIPNLDIPFQYIEPVALPLLIGSMVLFADSFLELKGRLPKLHATSLVILSGWGAQMLLIPFSSYRFLANLMVPWSLISLIVIFIAGIASSIKGYRSSRFFLLAWLGLIASLLWVFLVRLGLASSSMLSENAFRAGFLWMAVCWSIALADRINLLKAETESANRDLQASERRLSQILEGLPLGVVLYGKDHKPKYANRRSIEILSDPSEGIQPDISAGRTLAQAIQYFSLKVAGRNEEYPLENLPVYSALHGQPAAVDDIEADRGDMRVPLEIQASPIKDDNGNVESAVVAFQDITLRKQAEKAQRISETRFRVIAENNFDSIAFLGRDHKVIYTSPSYQRLVGKTAEELVGLSGIGLVHPDDRDYTAKKYNELLQQPNTRISAEYRVPHKDGSWIWVETFGINMLDNPYIQAVVLNIHDITDRKQKEAELAEYRTHLENMVEKRTTELTAINEQLQQRIDWLSAINLVTQTLARLADFSQIYEKILEIINNLFTAQVSFIAEVDESGKRMKILAHTCRSEESIDLNWTSPTLLEEFFSESNMDQAGIAYIPKDQLAGITGPLGSYIQEMDIQNLMLVPLRLREQFFGYLGLGLTGDKPVITSDEEDLLRIFCTDIAQLLEDSRLVDQSKSLILAEERNRLARDLHDSVTQTLFTASVLAETTPRIWDKDQDLARLNMEKLSLLIRGALAEMRSLLLELRSGELQNQTLSQLLATLAEAGRVRTRAEISSSVMGERTLPDNVTLTFYDIAREALNNAINHGKATQINISLIEDPDSVELRIRDNGLGFTPHAVPEGHLGINIMLERAAQIGADLRIRSEPGEGSELFLTWSDKVELEEHDAEVNH
jgi:PAS domain S-box-containing protein